MTTNKEWSDAAREFLASRRARFEGVVPDDEQLAAFFRGDLAESEAEDVRTFLSVFPEVGQAFSDEAVPQVGPTDPAHLSAAEKQEIWAALATRVGLPVENTQTTTLPFSTAASAAPRRTDPKRRLRRPWFAIAASLAVLTISTVVLRETPWGSHLLGTREATTLRLIPNRATRSLSPSPLSVFERPAGDAILEIFLSDPPPKRLNYHIDLYAEGAPIQTWAESDAIHPEDGGIIRLRVKRSLLLSRSYELQVKAVDSSGPPKVSLYTFRIR